MHTGSRIFIFSVLLQLHVASVVGVRKRLDCAKPEDFICQWDMSTDICNSQNWQLAGCRRRKVCAENHGDMDLVECCNKRDLKSLNETLYLEYMSQCAPRPRQSTPTIKEMQCSELDDFMCEGWAERPYCQLRQQEAEGCRNERTCTSSEYPKICCLSKKTGDKTQNHNDRYMRKCLPHPATQSHCEVMKTQAAWCESTFGAWVSGHDLMQLCVRDCDEWWGRMDLGHWIREANIPRTYMEYPKKPEDQADLRRRSDRAYAMTAREWRVMCARAISERHLCKTDSERQLSLMSTRDWMRRMALVLEQDVESGRKLDDSPKQYAYRSRPAGNGSRADDWADLEAAAADAWRNRLLKLEELAVHRPSYRQFPPPHNSLELVYEKWKSTLLNMTRMDARARLGGTISR